MRSNEDISIEVRHYRRFRPINEDGASTMANGWQIQTSVTGLLAAQP